MTRVRLATGAEQPINRHGAVSTVSGEEGDPVGMDSNGQWVAADAASGTAVNALGVLAAPVTDPADFASVPEVQDVIVSERELVGENRIAAVKNGVILVNSDEDWGFTPGQPIYLGTGGGFTQTKPSASGDIVQILGVAINDGNEMFLDVDYGYETVV